GDLFLARQSEGARLSVQDSVVALDGAILRTQGIIESTPDSDQIELRLDHVTAALKGGLLRMESGEAPRKLTPVQVTAYNNILCTTRSEPLIAMAGNSASEDFGDLLRWKGQKNFYDGFQGFWTTTSSDGMGRAGSMNFEAWRRYWTSTKETK